MQGGQNYWYPTQARHLPSLKVTRCIDYIYSVRGNFVVGDSGRSRLMYYFIFVGLYGLKHVPESGQPCTLSTKSYNSRSSINGWPIPIRHHTDSIAVILHATLLTDRQTDRQTDGRNSDEIS